MEPLIDVTRLRRSCAHCTVRQDCLPAEVDALGGGELDAFARPHRSIDRSGRLYRSGDALTSLYVVRDGALKTVTLAQDGEEQVLAFHLPGEILGLDALATGLHRCEVVALGSASVCELPFTDLTALAARSPALQQQLWRAIGRSAGRDQDHVEMLIRRQAHERIALFLYGLVERYRQTGGAAAQLLLPMSREDIGRFLGMALETVSRGFTRLQDDGVIGVAGRRVEVRDSAELARLARQG